MDATRLMTMLDTFKYLRHKNVRNDKTHLLVACMPKSGSSYFSALLSELPDMHLVSLVKQYDRNEQELSEIALLRCHSISYVTQNHIRYSAVTETLIDDFNLTSIVLVRDIFDIVQSLCDHVYNISPIWPLAYLDEDMKSWPRERMLAFIAEMMVPWYFNFYASWAPVKNKILIRYEDMRDNPAKEITKVTDFAGLHVDPSDVQQAIEKIGGRTLKMKNKGESGRGAQLPDTIKDSVRKMAQYYPKLDFSPIGL